jgi:hypothetical protein
MNASQKGKHQRTLKQYSADTEENEPLSTNLPTTRLANWKIDQKIVLKILRACISYQHLCVVQILDGRK